MKRILATALTLTAYAGTAHADDRITVHVKQAHADTQRRVYVSPGTPSRSETECKSDYTGSDVKCVTTATPGTAPTAVRYTVVTDVQSVFEANGITYNVTCHRGWYGSKCQELPVGRSYKATLDSKGRWIEVRLGALTFVKYDIIDRAGGDTLMSEHDAIETRRKVLATHTTLNSALARRDQREVAPRWYSPHSMLH